MRIVDVVLLSRYALKDKEVKFQANALAWSLLGITALSIVLIALNSLASSEASGFDFSYVLLGLSLLLLFTLARGWLRVAGLSLVVLLSLIMIAMVLSVPAAERFAVYLLGFMEIFVLVLSTLFSSSRVPAYLNLGFSIVGMASTFFFMVLPAGMAGLMLDDYIIAVFILITATAVVSGVTGRRRELLRQSENSVEAQRLRAVALSGIIAELEGTLRLGDDLSGSAERTIGAIDGIRDSLAGMRRGLEDLLAGSVAVDTANDRVAISASVMKSAVGDQGAAVEESSAAVIQMSASIKNIAKIASEHRNSIRSLQDNATSGMQIFEQVAVAVDSLVATLTSMNDVTQVIRTIASRTNLLAMNASIEAAHAGEAGAGFAVVAAEIRNLSAETAKNVRIIGDTLRTIAESIHAVAGLNASTRAMYEDVSLKIAGVSVAMDEIVSVVAELSSGTGAITNGTVVSVTASSKVDFETKAVVSAIGSIREAKSMLDAAISGLKHGLAATERRLGDVSMEALSVLETGKGTAQSLAGLKSDMDKARLVN
jgi:methyl-accepting chemotaxis protein